MPVRDFLLAVLPAQQRDLAVDLGREVDETEVEAFEMAAAFVDLGNQRLQLFDQLALLRPALDELRNLELGGRLPDFFGQRVEGLAQLGSPSLQASHDQLEAGNQGVDLRDGKQLRFLFTRHQQPPNTTGPGPCRASTHHPLDAINTQDPRCAGLHQAEKAATLNAMRRTFPAFLLLATSLLPAAAAAAADTTAAVRRESLGRAPDGNEVRMSELRGRVVVLAFWASWCVPCRFELPELNRIARIYRSKDVSVIAVNKGEELKTTRPTLDEILAHKDERLAMRITSDPTSDVAGSFGVFGLPTTMLFDAKGTLRAEYTGFEKDTTEKLIGQIAVLLAEARDRATSR